MDQTRTRLPRDWDGLLRVIVTVQLCYATRDSCLLPRAELILATLVGVGSGALLVLRIDGDLGGIVACIDYVGPAGCDSSG